MHLTDFPEPVAGRALTRDVDAAMALARRVVALGRAARAASGIKTRQPLAAVRVKLPGRWVSRAARIPLTEAELRAESSTSSTPGRSRC